MLSNHRILTVLCIVALASVAGAQTAPETSTPPPASSAPATSSAPVLPPVESVLSHIPADALGFVAVNKISQTTGNVETFLNNIGVGQMLPFQQMPNGMVDFLRMSLMLGEGFNADGGFAAVMLDPQQFGIDLMKMMRGEPTFAPDGTRIEPKLPFILFVPGASAEAVFGNYPIEDAGPFKRITLRMGPMFSIQAGGYVALSPSPKALLAMGKATKKASDVLSESQAKTIAESDLAIHLNMKIVGPIYVQFLKQMTEQMDQMSNAMPGMDFGKIMSLYSDIYCEILAQIDTITMSLRFDPTGLLISENVRWDPESDWGKMVAACQPIEGELLGNLPDLPYVLAMGSASAGTTELERVIGLKMLDKMLASEFFADIPQETKTELRLLGDKMSGQVTASQVVIGGVPEGAGVVGLVVVMNCIDAKTVQGLYAGATPIYETLINSMLPDLEEGEKKLRLSYASAAGKIGETPYDTITISTDDLDNLDEDDREKLRKILGEDELRYRIASADEKTLVLTFGGADPLLAEALQTARTGGTIQQSAAAAGALKHMPKKPIMLMLFNVSNLFELIGKGTQAIDPDAAFPFSITTPTPIAAGASVAGSEMLVVVHMPIDLIQEVVQKVMMRAMGFGGRHPQPQSQPAPVGDDDDF